MATPARQYTIRRVPDHVERALRRRAKTTGKSFNEVALEALALGSGEELRPKRALGRVVGSLSQRDAARMDEEVQRQRQLDGGLWK